MTCVASGVETASGRPAAVPSESLNTGVMCHSSGVTEGCCNVCVRVCVCAIV